MRTKNDRRPLKVAELRYVVFKADQHERNPARLKQDARLHIARAMVTADAVILACTGEAHRREWETYDAYPYYQWFEECGAPVCGKCKRRIEEDIEANGLLV